MTVTENPAYANLPSTSPLGMPLDWKCQRAGLTPVHIQRLRVGSIALAGLPEGQWRYMGERERF